MIDVNLRGVLYGVAAALPRFEKQGSGHFINLSSVAGLKVFSPGGAVYSATKFAVRAISEGLRAEVGGAIRTTTIYPGAVESGARSGELGHRERQNRWASSTSKPWSGRLGRSSHRLRDRSAGRRGHQ